VKWVSGECVKSPKSALDYFEDVLRETSVSDARKNINMALKKSELYSSLWQSCDALRGGMDAS